MSAILQTRSSSVANGTDPRVLNLRPGKKSKPDSVNGARLQAVFAALPAVVLVLDGRGRVVEANPAAFELFERPLLGETWRHLLQRDFSTRVDRGDLLAGDGRRYTVSTHPLGTEPGQIVMLTDVSESRELQSQLAHQDRLAEMGKMAASLAHQVRTPLSTALLYVSHLENPSLEPEQRSRFVQRMHERLRHLEQMVRDLLMFARSGGFSCEVLDLGGLLDAVAEEIRPRMPGGRLSLDMDPQIRLWGNHEALRAALLNLADNAVRACPTELELRFSANQVNADEICIAISDNGPGIDADKRERVFEPFFTTRSDGTGLGLPVVANIIEAHGGRIALVPTTIGTRFEISLPRVNAAVAGAGRAIQ